AAGIGIPLVFMPKTTIGAVMTLAVFVWILIFSLRDLWEKSAHSRGRLHGLGRLSGSYFGMQIAHLGVACAILGGGLTSIYNLEKDARMEPGAVVELAGYSFVFEGVRPVKGSNFVADEALVSVSKNGKIVATLYPQKRRYTTRNQVMTEAGIDGGLT